MRVLSLATNGRSRFYQQQIERLRDRGHAVDMMVIPQSDSGESRSVVAYARYYVRALAATPRGYDVVHANYGLTAPPAVVQPFAPTVVSLWGSDLMGRYGSVSRTACRFADAVVVMSEEMSALAGLDCHVIPHGVNMDLFRPLPRGFARSAVEWDPDHHHVLFPYSRDRAVKDFPRARRIVDAVNETVERPVELHTINGVPHDRMPLYFNAADALLLTSQREGSPNAVKEALACDCPVVATDVGDVADRLDGVFNTAVGDDDDELARRLAAILASGARPDGHASVAPLGIERQIDKLVEVYRSVADAPERQ